MEVLDGNLGGIIIGGLSVVLTFGARYLLKYAGTIKDIKDVIDVTTKAIEDGQVTKEELEVIIKEVRDIVG